MLTSTPLTSIPTTRLNPDYDYDEEAEAAADRAQAQSHATKSHKKAKKTMSNLLAEKSCKHLQKAKLLPNRFYIKSWRLLHWYEVWERPKPMHKN